MKTTSVRFAQLRRLLIDPHFRETRDKGYWQFEHPESDTVFLFRRYAPDDHVTMQDLATARTHLDWRGLLSGEAFEDSLTKTPA